MRRLYLSPPNVGNAEIAAVESALRSGWVAPLGPDVDAFERELAEATGRVHAVALASGTAALHLGLKALGVGPDDEVVVPTLTFGATAFAVTYLGANPVFLDVESGSWTLDPDLLEGFLRERSTSGRLPSAVIPVDVFGRTCDYDRILSVCEDYAIPVLTDAAESLGAMHGSAPAGSTGAAAVVSFNGNKIITTSGGGALVTDNESLATQVRKWAAQSREPYPWYEHVEVGFNYRMSNVLAAVGRAQLARLSQFIERRRAIRDQYALGLAQVEGVSVLGDPAWGQWNGWLTTIRFDSGVHPGAATRVREALEQENIETRPVWKPMHQQPVFQDSDVRLTGVADRIFEEGLCIPTGSAMTDGDVNRVLAELTRALVR